MGKPLQYTSVEKQVQAWARAWSLPESWLSESDANREFGTSLREAVVSIVDVITAVGAKARSVGIRTNDPAEILSWLIDELDSLSRIAERGVSLHELAVEWRTMKRELAEAAMRAVERLGS